MKALILILLLGVVHGAIANPQDHGGRNGDPDIRGSIHHNNFSGGEHGPGSVAGAAAEASSNTDVAVDNRSHISPVLNISDNYEQAASSAAAVHSVYCAPSASAQIDGGGFAISNPSQFCMHIEMAKEMWRAHREAPEECEHKCVAECDAKGAFHVELQSTPCRDKAFYLGEWRYHLEAASNFVKSTSWTAKIGAWFGNLSWPIAVTLALILL